MNFAQRIRYERINKGLTQEQFGAIFNKAGSTVRSWELGKSMPTCNMLIKIAQKMGKTADYLLGLMEDADNGE